MRRVAAGQKLIGSKEWQMVGAAWPLPARIGPRKFILAGSKSHAATTNPAHRGETGKKSPDAPGAEGRADV